MCLCIKAETIIYMYIYECFRGTLLQLLSYIYIISQSCPVLSIAQTCAHMLMQSDIETSECLSFNGSLPAVWFKMKFVEC